MRLRIRAATHLRCQAQCQQQGIDHRLAAVVRGAVHQGHEFNPVKALRLGRATQAPGGTFQRCLGQFHRQPGLATATRPDQGDQAVRRQIGPQARADGFATEQARQVARQRMAALRHRLARQGVRQGVGQDVHPCGQPGAFVLDPIVVKAGQQLTPVQRHGPCRLARLRQPLKAQHIAVQRTGDQAHGAPVGLQHGRCAGGLQRAAQRRQGLAQPVAADVQAHVGPQVVDQFLARMDPVGLQRQTGQQGHHRPALQPCQALAATAQLKPAQQAQLPGRRGSARRGPGGQRAGADGRRGSGGCRRCSHRRAGRRARHCRRF